MTGPRDRADQRPKTATTLDSIAEETTTHTETEKSESIYDDDKSLTSKTSSTSTSGTFKQVSFGESHREEDLEYGSRAIPNSLTSGWLQMHRTRLWIIVILFTALMAAAILGNVAGVLLSQGQRT